MSDLPQCKARAGCLRRLMVFFVFGVFTGLGLAVFFMVMPQDLSDLEQPAAALIKPRDLTEVLHQAVERKYEVTLTEAEINAWLATASARLAKEGDAKDRLWVRLLEKNQVEVILIRHFLGKPFTSSMFLGFTEENREETVIKTVEIHGGTYHPDLPMPLRGGRFGKLVVPQGFLRLVLPLFRTAAEKFSEEIRLGFEEMTHIRVEKHRLILDPRVEFSDETILLPR